MSIGDYARHAEVWELYAQDRTEEVDFWARVAGQYGKTVLTAMSATGQVAAGLADRGLKVTAVDITKEMVEEGTRRYGGRENLFFVEGDIRTLDLAERICDFAFIGTTSFHHLLTASDRAAGLKILHAHTRPGGGLGLELWYPSSKSWSSPWRTFEPVQAPNDQAVKVWKRGKTEFNAERCLVTITQEVFIEREGQTTQFPHVFSLQLFDRETLATALASAGYTMVREYGSYAGDPWAPESPKWIIEATKD